MIDSLEYIANLNVNALWLTLYLILVLDNQGRRLDATGYFPCDYFNVDPKFGTIIN